jgi:hypothetical protein
MVKNAAMKSVHCQCYDWSSLDVLPMLRLVFSECLRADDTIGRSPVVKMTSLILLHLYDPTTETLWQYYHVMPTPSIN